MPTRLSDIYGKEIGYDFSGSSGSAAGGWFSGQAMPFPRYYSASVMYSLDETIWLYVFGGDTTGNGNATVSCLRYNVNLDSWEYISPLPAPLRVSSAAKAGSKFYVIGGFDGPDEMAVRKMFEYDVSSDSWSEKPDIPEALYYHKSFGYRDSLIFIAGGVRSDSGGVFSEKVYMFNIFTNQFSEASPLPERRANFAVTVLNDSVFISGGFSGSDSLSNKTIIGVIDPADHNRLTFSSDDDSLALYPVQVHSHFGFPRGRKEINFFGGSVSAGFSPVNNFYTFGIPENVFKVIANNQPAVTAFSAGYIYLPTDTPSDSVLVAVISGGVISGPSVTGQTWIYRDTVFATDLSETGNGIPSGYNLKQNYPNPFNSSTAIEFEIPGQSFVRLEIFNELGQKISVLVSEELPAGTYKYVWNADQQGGQTSGVYFCRFTAGNFSDVKKIIMVK